MMDERIRRKAIRKDFSRQGWTLLIYYGIMNAAVLVAVLIDTIILTVEAIITYGPDLPDAYMEDMAARATGNAWGYFLAVGFGFLILLLWKGRKFTFHDIWVKGRPMRAGELFTILCVFMSGQLLFQMFALILELILNLLGFSAMAAIESATMSQMDTFSMFLYAGLLAPIAEEILFRGLILRSLQPYGKKTAIFVSALLFGLFHGNIVQTPFAFAVGLVLGYVAVEYSMVWAMALHMFNNLLISDVLTRLTSRLAPAAADLITVAVLWGFAAAGFILAIVKRKEIGKYLRGNRMDPVCLKCCFSSAGIIVLTVVMVINMLLSITFL